MPGFSMMGSGIYSTTVTREIICAERCWECEDQKQSCDNAWEEDFETDDWGNVDADIKCSKCGHGLNYKEEAE